MPKTYEFLFLLRVLCASVVKTISFPISGWGFLFPPTAAEPRRAFRRGCKAALRIADKSASRGAASLAGPSHPRTRVPSCLSDPCHPRKSAVAFLLRVLCASEIFLFPISGIPITNVSPAGYFRFFSLTIFLPFALDLRYPYS